MTALGALGFVAVLLTGTYVAAVVDAMFTSRRLDVSTLLAPAVRTSQSLAQTPVATERPDGLLLVTAPPVYLTLAAIGLGVVPFAPGAALLDVETGVVWWGAMESLTVVAVFLHGWAPNSPFPLHGAYRYVAIGLSAMLLSMFVLIGAALPAESLRIERIVEAQSPLWNVFRQPLGLPLFMLLGLTLTLRGPLDYADSEELAGGTSAEASAAGYVVWQFARAAMLVAFSAMAASVFLGGYLGPWLPGPIWLLGKSLAVLVGVIALGRRLARLDPSRMLTVLWVVLLPLAFADLLIAGVLALR